MKVKIVFEQFVINNSNGEFFYGIERSLKKQHGPRMTVNITYKKIINKNHNQKS